MHVINTVHVWKCTLGLERVPRRLFAGTLFLTSYHMCTTIPVLSGEEPQIPPCVFRLSDFMCMCVTCMLACVRGHMYAYERACHVESGGQESSSVTLLLQPNPKLNDMTRSCWLASSGEYLFSVF